MRVSLGDFSRAGQRLLALAAVAGTFTAGCTAASAPHAHPRLRLGVSERVSLYDVPLDIRVSGLHPGEKVTLRLETADQLWSAWAAAPPP
jgi:hypothetical protein